MTLAFPSKVEIRLANGPLQEVICQVRFPPILRLASEEPVAFQDGIRAEFPFLELEQGVLLRFPGVGAGESPSAESQPKTYRFRSSDERTVISLASEFFAVSTNRYTHWTEFANALDIADRAVKHHYQPAFAKRIGLRFVNRLTLENTGATELEGILQFLNDDLTRFYRIQALGGPLEMDLRVLLADEHGRLNVRVSQAQNESKVPFVLLDFDYFEDGRLPLDGLLDRCDGYHEAIYRAFRWSVVEDKMEAFGPIVGEI